MSAVPVSGVWCCPVEQWGERPEVQEQTNSASLETAAVSEGIICYGSLVKLSLCCFFLARSQAPRTYGKKCCAH